MSALLRVLIVFLLAAPLWASTGGLLFASAVHQPLSAFRSPDFSLALLAGAINTPVLRDALEQSAIVSTSAGIWCSLVGWYAAWGARQIQSIYVRQAFVMVLFLPLVLPPDCLSLGLMASFRFWGITSGKLTIVIAHGMMYSGIAASFHAFRLEQLRPAVLQTAANLGVDRGTLFWKIYFRHQYPTLVAAAVVVMALSFNEAVVATYVGGFSRPFAVRVLHMLSASFDPALFSVATMAFVMSAVSVAAGCWLQFSVAGGDREIS